MKTLFTTVIKAFLLLIFSILNLSAASCWAHKASDSYLSLTVQGHTLQGQWDIALRDLENVLSVDSDGDGAITWGELRTNSELVMSYASRHLRIADDRTICPLRTGKLLADKHSDGAYAVLSFQADCPSTPKSLKLHYSLFFDVDPQHRGLLRWQLGQGKNHTAIFSSERRDVRLEPANAASHWDSFRDYLGHGAWHIWIGYDHILFLLSLLLPAVFLRRHRQWQPQTRFRPVALEVLKVVTAFTLAHSMTLSLAVLGLIRLPSQWVESVIAASVILAALNNLYPVMHGGRAGMAFGFGLIHGMGFANVLSDLGLPPEALLAALLGFNVGVELGQLAIVAIFLPVAYLLRMSFVYRALIFNTGSGLIAGLATIWLLERSLNLRWDLLW
jgi:hypothetical protein